ncbi:MAG TPA: hypothetical protein VI383_03090, partial [Gemmatimonadales bacterium]|nr:hypothetical protein [Gemmatimonadales bacterium]
MKDPKAHDISEIESLLASRQQLSEWLNRLDQAGARAPESVRAKVRADYQGRMAQVVAQLSTHRDVISSTLEGLKAQREEISQLRNEELDVRAEAELRHAVGEYGDDEWQLVELESSSKITGFDGEIERLAGEIRRHAEVLALMASEPESRPASPASAALQVSAAAERRPGTPDPSAPPTRPRLAAETEEAPIVPARPEAPRFVPRSGTVPPQPAAPRHAARTPPPPPPPPPPP